MQIFKTKIGKKITLPYFSSLVQAGFPSPADDYINEKLDLNEFLIEHPASTFFLKIEGESMKDAGIFAGDMIVVDRSKIAKNGDIILAVVNSEFTVKRFKKNKDEVYLISENTAYKPILITDNTYFEVWGVVSSIIRKF